MSGLGRIVRIGCVALLAGACAATRAAAPPRYDLRAPLAAHDLYRPHVRVWQAAARLERQRRAAEGPRPVAAASPPLADAYRDFRGALRRDVARRTLAFVQLHSGLYLVDDGEHDHWPTLSEVLRAGGDDCDGMDVLTFELLRDLGFGAGELYRAVLAHPDGRHHMVSIWLEAGRERDPWVLDPTGEVRGAMVPLSAIAPWRPVTVFDEVAHYTPVQVRAD